MTVSTTKKRTTRTPKPKSRSAAKTTSQPHGTKKPLRVKPEFLPDSATYGTFAGREYVMIPVEDFGEWYEDALDGAVVDHIRSCGEEAIPADEVYASLGIKPAGRK